MKHFLKRDGSEQFAKFWDTQVQLQNVYDAKILTSVIYDMISFIRCITITLYA